MNDCIGDMIIRIKNAQKIKLRETNMFPFLSKNDIGILKILYNEGYLRGYTQSFDILKQKNVITVLLKYNLRGEPIIRNIVKISTPGRRIYLSTKTL